MYNTTYIIYRIGSYNKHIYIFTYRVGSYQRPFIFQVRYQHESYNFICFHTTLYNNIGSYINTYIKSLPLIGRAGLCGVSTSE